MCTLSSDGVPGLSARPGSGQRVYATPKRLSAQVIETKHLRQAEQRQQLVPNEVPRVAAPLLRAWRQGGGVHLAAKDM